MPQYVDSKLNEEQDSLPTKTVAPTIETPNTLLSVESSNVPAISDSELSESEIIQRVYADNARTTEEIKQYEREVIAQEKANQLRIEEQQRLQQQALDTSNVAAAEAESLIEESFILIDDETLINTECSPNTTTASSTIYPSVLELEDQPITIVNTDNILKPNIDLNTEVDAGQIILPSPRRKRQRRVYVAEPQRRATLRVRKSDTESTALSPSTEPVSPLIIDEQRTEVEEHKTRDAPLTDDYLNPEFLNRIEIVEYEEPKTLNKRRRRNPLGWRKRVAKTNPTTTTLPPNQATASLELSPTTAAAVEAAQLELDSSPSTSSAQKKRTRNMSLYDRRYQTADDRRGTGVGNGYVGNTTRNSSAGSTSGAHSDIDAQDMVSSNQQYYMSSSSNSVASAGLNGSINHAPSMGTLCNIGNTCYLNSVVYTLRFAPHFLHNLHHLIHDINSIQQLELRQRSSKSASLGRGVSAAYLENARSWSSKDLASLEQYNGSGSGGNAAGAVGVSCDKSSHQSLTEKLHDLYQSLNRNELSDSSEPYHADTLLHAIQEVNSTFEGNQQQDAHEFLMCLLNSLREANQSLIKSIGDYPDFIVNGYIVNSDEMEASCINDKDNAASAMSSNSALSVAGTGAAASSNTSSHSTKSSFFSRKSKRKEESKNAKASRLQSPLKEGSQMTTSSGVQMQPTSNSLFYLNTVDLSGANAMQSTVPATALKSVSDDESSSAVSLLKDKVRLEEKIRELNLDFFSEDFEGVVVLTTKCLSCETITKQKQGMLDISVPVPISGYDNTDYTDKPSSYIQNSCITREYFRGDNKYSCDQCTGYTEAIRSISYEVLPRLLVVQLNRFSGGMEKINTYVPTTFTLPCFCVKCCELSEANKLHVYKLYSVITHVGATLSVGHYIAYTCCLDWANEYANCPKDRRNAATLSQQGNTVVESAPIGSSSSSSNVITPVSVATTAASVLASSGTSIIKKMKFGRNKASSSGDMSKNVKQLNGITSKAITNGIGKLSMNTTCHGLNCCAMRFCKGPTQLQQATATSAVVVSGSGVVVAGGNNSAGNSDFSEESAQNGTNSNLSYSNNSGNSSGNSSTHIYPTGYGSTGRGGVSVSGSAATSSDNKSNYINPNAAESVWYMCDDDKIKAMTQREFEDLLSPTRKITITPYLLFYARFDLQPTLAKQTTPTPPQTSWSNESLQSGGSHQKF